MTKAPQDALQPEKWVLYILHTVILLHIALIQHNSLVNPQCDHKDPHATIALFQWYVKTALAETNFAITFFNTNERWLQKDLSSYFLGSILRICEMSTAISVIIYRKPYSGKDTQTS